MGSIPQHVSIITLGTHDLTTIRDFYARWGWEEFSDSQEFWCAYDLGGTLLSFYLMDDLAGEAVASSRSRSDWGGFTLAINFQSKDELSLKFGLALDAGATLIADLQDREWGGTSGYLADPDGNRWEFAFGGPNPVPGSDD